MAAEFTNRSESAQIELHTLLIDEEMKNDLKECKKSEAATKQLVVETLMQLETAKKTVETLRSNGCNRVNFLEKLVIKLKAALENAEIKHNEEIRNASQTVERIKSASGQREAELEAELRKSKYEIEELKANATDKENELQCIRDENERLKVEINEMISRGKIGISTDEVEKSNKKTERVIEELEAAQKANVEMEGELRRLKVVSDQFRKAAETAVALLSAGDENGRLVERTGSMDGGYSRRTTMRISSVYLDDFGDEDILKKKKKKNGNVLSMFGVMWNKAQK